MCIGTMHDGPKFVPVLVLFPGLHKHCPRWF
jgi:hypothetical protein